MQTVDVITRSPLVDSGKRINFGEGQATREPTTGKGRFDLVSPFALERIAKHYENGALKYADRNWEKGMPIDRCIESALRHINEYQKHRVYGFPLLEDHLSASIWNLMCVIHFEEHKTEQEEIQHVD